MPTIDKLTKPSHLINMSDIIREGNPTLRAVAENVTFPLSDQDIILGEKMMQFLKNSQDPVIAEKMGLRGVWDSLHHSLTSQNVSLLSLSQIQRTLMAIRQKKPTA